LFQSLGGFPSHAACLTTWTWLFRAVRLDKGQIREESKKEIPGDGVFENWLSPAGAFLRQGMWIHGEQLKVILAPASK